MPKQPPLFATYVEWVDSQTTYGWQRFDEREDRQPAIIHSVGLLVDSCKNSISLSTSRSKNGRVVDFITIPRVAIKKLKKLKV